MPRTETVTVVFTDLVGSTAADRQIDGRGMGDARRAVATEGTHGGAVCRA